MTLSPSPAAAQATIPTGALPTGALPTGGWRLESFHRDGVTASCSADLRVHLQIGPGGAVVLRTDGATVTGALLARGDDAAAFVDMVLDPAPWGRVTEALEDQVACCLVGTFAWSSCDGSLTLRRAGYQLRFVAG